MCDKTFTIKANLTYHQKTVHENLLKNCSICQKSIGVTNIKSHEKCVKCPKFYDNKKSLQSHIRHVHEQKQIKCEKCNKVLKSSLERHMNKVHKVFSGRFSR